jgi:hypothetical protein
VFVELLIVETIPTLCGCGEGRGGGSGDGGGGVGGGYESNIVQRKGVY